MNRNVENIEAVETEEIKEAKESKIKTAASKVGAGIKKHWKKVAVGAAAVAIGLIGYTQMSKKNHDCDDSEFFDDEADVVIDIDDCSDTVETVEE